jgi:transposase
MGEDVTETLEVIPRRWKVIQTVREKFTCRACEKISHPKNFTTHLRPRIRDVANDVLSDVN